jgi:cytochrome c oxidase cbb3-type subunit II
MNKGPLIFLGVFLALAFSWAGIVLTNQIQFGGLTAYYDANEGKTFPDKPSGLAERGRLVYQDLGCVYCHSQQVRRPDFGADTARGWGERQSVARDYVYDKRVFLGTMRTGPDLRNIGARQSTGDWFHYLHLYDPRLVAPGSTMPPFRFLFVYRPIPGEPSPKALKLKPDYAHEHGLDKPGYELVPTPRAEALVAYLMSLRDTYEFPEAKPYVPPKPKGAPK